MRRLLPIVFALMAPVGIAARTVIEGSVSNDDGAPVVGAMVKVSEGGSIKAFAATKANGYFTLAFDGITSDSLTVTADKMNFERLSLRVPNKSHKLKLTMRPTATRLREVVVSAPVVYQRGDTLRFNLAQFIGKGDISLEDALRKVPGITVSSSGKISYMGKDISNFYIEGLDMLGGNYSLATQNLPAENVACLLYTSPSPRDS